MDLGLRGKVALVTGASRGIGKAIAQSLLKEGCRVAICARDVERLRTAVAELSHGKNGADTLVIGLPTDITDDAAVQKFVATAHETFGRIDILVNNAGTHLRGTVDTTTLDILERQLRDKVFGFFSAIKAVLPIMRRQKDGRIINIVGQAARHPHPDRFPSGVTNAACMALTKSVADAVARDNIRVNAVCPQYIESDLLASLIDKEMRERKVDRVTASAGFSRANPLGRTGTPEEVADLVSFLVSDTANFVTGSSVSIDGGYQRYVFG
ncbi:MAG TPA: SDR family oxidoreductase [Pseudolabrys sp.]|nr:SDR family oxidoreductase [Pseudolabrys sp.]